MESEKRNKIISIKQWIATIFITSIPLVGIVMLCVWVLGGGAPKSKENFAKATLI